MEKGDFFMKKNRKLLAALLSALLVLSLSSAALAETTIRFSWWGGDERHVSTLAAIELFEGMYPDIKVEAEYSGWDGYKEKLLTQLVGGTAPDVIQVDQPWLAEMSGQGADFLDLSTVSDKINYADMGEAFIESYCTIDGELMGLPTGQNAATLFVNEALLAEAGVEVPGEWTFDALITAGEALHTAMPEKYLLIHDRGVLSDIIQPIYIQQLAGGYFNDDYTLAFTEEDLAHFYTWVDGMFKSGALQPQSEASLYDGKLEQNPKWINGDYAMLINWASTYSNMYGNVDFAEGVNAQGYPYVEGGDNKNITVRPSQVLSINGASANQEAAMLFVDFFFNDEEAIKALGTSRSVPSGERARAILLENDMIEPVIAKASDMAVPRAAAPVSSLANNSEITDLFDETVELLGYGRMTPEEAAASCYADVLAKLDELKDL